MRANWLNTSRLLLVVITMSLFSGCAKKWVTHDGKTVEISSDAARHQDSCDSGKNINYVWDSTGMCWLFSNDLAKIDPVNAVKYKIKACDRNNKYCNYVADATYENVKEGIFAEELRNEFGSYVLNLCLKENLISETGHDSTWNVCNTVARLYELDPPNIEIAKSAYKRNCDRSGDCYDYERLGGPVDWNLAERQQAYSERMAAQSRSDRKREVEENNREIRERNRQSAEEKRQWNENINSGLQSMQNSLNQGAQTYNNAVQANRDADAYLRRQKEDREREARELQLQRNEEANQQRQAEENRRHQQQVALERSQREELERQQRQKDEQQRVAQQEADKQRQQQKKQLSCTNMTPSVSGTLKRLKGAGHCDGELAAYLTNNSGIKVMCEQKFERNGVLPGSGSGAQVHIRPGETVGGESGGLWECGHADSDSYKYYCIADDEPYECMRKF